jgi:ActR/RegA family two-component response regulator
MLKMRHAAFFRDARPDNGNMSRMMPTPPRRILIGEDDAQTKAVMARLIFAQGFDVVTASTLAEARQCAEAGDIGFLITDLGLADGNG